ncbi:MAG: PadR family transcriptional regulator [Planctomycetia bacterium]|nr:PadR family transcriptional regulator [Planctomycetia bacterium]
MADKITQQITDALTRAASSPDGLPLFAGKTDAGLFPNTAAAKPAAQKCLADELVSVIATDTKGKSPRELYSLTEKGWEFLLAAVNPKQVLEDFVRVLEARQGEVGELLDTARRMAESLQGLKEAVTRVLPGVSAGKIQKPTPNPSLQGGEKEVRALLERTGASDASASSSPSLREGTEDGGAGPRVALLDAPPETDLASSILAHLADWTGATDCPLPELFRALTVLELPPSIGAFHDCLRHLHADGAITLPAWTGPLYAMPEPAYALLVGHGIAYYASLRRQ